MPRGVARFPEEVSLGGPEEVPQGVGEKEEVLPMSPLNEVLFELGSEKRRGLVSTLSGTVVTHASGWYSSSQEL